MLAPATNTLVPLTAPPVRPPDRTVAYGTAVPAVRERPGVRHSGVDQPLAVYDDLLRHGKIRYVGLSNHCTVTHTPAALIGSDPAGCF